MFRLVVRKFVHTPCVSKCYVRTLVDTPCVSKCYFKIHTKSTYVTIIRNFPSLLLIRSSHNEAFREVPTEVYHEGFFDYRSNKILNKISSSQNQKLSINVQMLSELYEFLYQSGVDVKDIEAQLIGTPDLLNYSLKKWKSTYNTLVNHDLNSLVVFHRISLCPALLDMSEKELNCIIDIYFNIRIGKISLLNIAVKWPTLFLQDPKMIMDQVKKLKRIFTAIDCQILVKRCPTVLVDDYDAIMEKIMYIKLEMGLLETQIVESNALERTLLHIKTRHKVLEKAGIWRKTNPDKNPNAYRSLDRLTDIVDSPTKFFVTKVARISREEFDVFAELMKLEEENLDNDIDGDDDGDNNETYTNWKGKYV